ncbi:unnamed protein product [Durusdinium trenchii]|uniref:Uncharacterized protein n=1 Tax=Durusdinium trenchii TaxID=1381693 RepID=A0ABP0KVD4_9DINO
MEDPDEHTSLVKRVKQVQREGEESKQQWWAFCELEGKSNRRDPQRHSLQSLRRFFQIREQGGLPRSVQKLRSDAAAHQLWVQKLTEILRASEEAKQNWWDYCDKYHGGLRYPQQHTAKSIQTFFECHAAHGVPGAETAQKDLADDAAALATLSPEVACVTVKGQKTYVVQFQEPVFKALPDVLKFHPLSSQSACVAQTGFEHPISPHGGSVGQAPEASSTDRQRSRSPKNERSEVRRTVVCSRLVAAGTQVVS